MKRTILVLAICSVIAACGGSSNSGTSDSSTVSTTTTSTTTTASIDAATPGGKLITASDCLTCHKVDIKVIGPSYKDVAAKYPATEANIDTLANKIIKGGKGNWGDVPMSAHPNLSVADAKTIVKYILTLK